MKKFVCLIVFVAFAAQSEAALKCFKIIKNGTATTAGPDCIGELQNGGDSKLQPFTDVVTENEAKLRTVSNWCSTQEKFLSFVVPDNAPAGSTPPPLRRRKRTITSITDCTGIFNYTAENFANNDTAQTVYDSYDAGLKAFVDQLAADVGVSGDQATMVIYDACAIAIVDINSASLNATTTNLINTTCSELAALAPSVINITHCYECSIWALDNQQTIRDYYGITTNAP